MSRFLEAVAAAERARLRCKAPVLQPSRIGIGPGSRPFQVLTVTSNKGGVGKTTIATNLAVYLRAIREDLPVLVLSLDDQMLLDRMFALDSEPPEQRLAEALRAGDLAPAIRLGDFGVHYVPTSPDLAQLKRDLTHPFHLQEALHRTNWQGLVIVDTKSDLEILTRNAIATSDLAMVVVKDHASLLEAEKIYRLLDESQRPWERARILLSLVDLRIKFQAGESRDILAVLVSEIRRRNYPLFSTFVSSSPKVESLYTNPEGRAHAILHRAQGSVVHQQMRHLAHDVLAALDELRTPGSEATCAAAKPQVGAGDLKHQLLYGTGTAEDREPPRSFGWTGPGEHEPHPSRM